MKGLTLLILLTAYTTTSNADSLNDAVRTVSEAIGNHYKNSSWENRCSRTHAIRLYPNCYKNPDGIALWQMTGAERERWKPTAVQESIRLKKSHTRELSVAKEEGKHTANEQKLSTQMCRFWKQQNENEKQRAKVKEHCGAPPN